MFTSASTITEVCHRFVNNFSIFPGHWYVTFYQGLYCRIVSFEDRPTANDSEKIPLLCSHIINSCCQ